MISGIFAVVLMQPSGVFPFASMRIRPDGARDVVFVKDVRDKGTVLGQGEQITLLPRVGGCVFLTQGMSPTIVAFDTNGKKLTEFSKLGFGRIGRPAIDPSGNYMLAEFVGEFESEVWRIPMRGKGPATLITSLNNGNGSANPAFEMDGTSIWVKIGGTWNSLDLATAITKKIDIRPLTEGMPSGSSVLEVRPSHSVPKLVAVTVALPGDTKTNWVMVWDRQSNRVSRVSPIGVSADSVDWSRDGRYVLFNAVDAVSGRMTLQAANPSGGDPLVISVIKDAGQ